MRLSRTTSLINHNHLFGLNSQEFTKHPSQYYNLCRSIKLYKQGMVYVTQLRTRYNFILKNKDKHLSQLVRALVCKTHYLKFTYIV